MSYQTGYSLWKDLAAWRCQADKVIASLTINTIGDLRRINSVKLPNLLKMTETSLYTVSHTQVSIVLETEVNLLQAHKVRVLSSLWKRNMEKTDLVLSRQKWCNQFSSVLQLVHSLSWVLAAGVAFEHLAHWSASSYSRCRHHGAL